MLHDAPGPLVERQLAGIQEWENIEQRRITDADLPATTRTALVKTRVGQGLFKERVSQIERACRIMFVDNPAHLIGSHIKPWSECSNEERWDGANGLLLTPSADHSFDRGFISYDDNGDTSPPTSGSSAPNLGPQPWPAPTHPSWTSSQR